MNNSSPPLQRSDLVQDAINNGQSPIKILYKSGFADAGQMKILLENAGYRRVENRSSTEDLAIQEGGEVPEDQGRIQVWVK